jgi:hypothetical protein
MGEDVDELAERVADMEAPDALAGNADLWPRRTIGRKSDDPAMVHDRLETEEILVERPRRLQILRLDGGNDAANDHGVCELGMSLMSTSRLA